MSTIRVACRSVREKANTCAAGAFHCEVNLIDGMHVAAAATHDKGSRRRMLVTFIKNENVDHLVASIVAYAILRRQPWTPRFNARC